MKGKTTKKAITWGLWGMVALLAVLNFQMMGLTRNMNTMNAVISNLVIGNSGSQRGDLNLEGFAGCLVNSDAIFYGTEWCGFCAQQKQVLGDVYTNYGDQFYVDCDIENDRCRSAGITGYPTWIINGRPHVGVQSIEALSAAIGC